MMHVVPAESAAYPISPPALLHSLTGREHHMEQMQAVPEPVPGPVDVIATVIQLVTATATAAPDQQSECRQSCSLHNAASLRGTRLKTKKKKKSAQ